MSLRKFLWCFLAFAFLLSFAASHLPAQSSKSPQTYSLTEVNSMFGPSVTMKIYRDGSKALIDNAPTAAGPGGLHTRSLYDLQAQKTYSLDVTNPSSPCSPGTFSGDWGDPFAAYAEMTGDLAKMNPKVIGKQTINGFPTNALEVALPGGKGTANIWMDEKDGRVIKYEMVPASGPAQTIVEVKQLSFDKPAASIFALPPACAGVSAATPPPDSQRFAAETGGNADDFVNAIMPPPSHDSCAVSFKIVRAGTMEPITSEYKVGIDTSPGFSGGHTRDVTAEVKDGILRINNPPPHFEMQVQASGGDSDALIYRQCFGPPTVLLLVIKNPAKLSDGADWVWVKSGKFAK